MIGVAVSLVAVDAAAANAYFGVFFNGGQTCCAGTRVYVQEQVYDEFVDRCVAIANSQKVGDPFDVNHTQGPQVDLTRFNKIAIQGTPQIAVDNEALICLSRVYSYYSKCNLPLFYVYPALTRYLSILFLNILTLLACTHSFDNLFQTLMVLWENGNFLTSSLLCFFTSVKLCPLVFYFP